MTKDLRTICEEGDVTPEERNRYETGKFLLYLLLVVFLALIAKTIIP